MSQKKKLLIVLSSILVLIALGVMFVTGGTILDRVPKAQPTASVPENEPQTMPQIGLGEEPTLSEIPVPAPVNDASQAPAVASARTNNPNIQNPTAQEKSQSGITGKVRKFWNNIF